MIHDPQEFPETAQQTQIRENGRTERLKLLIAAFKEFAHEHEFFVYIAIFMLLYFAYFLIEAATKVIR